MDIRLGTNFRRILYLCCRVVSVHQRNAKCSNAKPICSLRSRCHICVPMCTDSSGMRRRPRCRACAIQSGHNVPWRHLTRMFHTQSGLTDLDLCSTEHVPSNPQHDAPWPALRLETSRRKLAQFR